MASAPADDERLRRLDGLFDALIRRYAAFGVETVAMQYRGGAIVVRCLDEELPLLMAQKIVEAHDAPADRTLN